MRRLWIPGWQMSEHCFDATKQLMNVEHELTLSYHQSPITLSHWLEQANDHISEPCEIVGWSLGGALAYLLASQNKLITNIRLINTNVAFRGEQGLPIEVADNFMFRYQTHAKSTRKRFAALVDSQQPEDIHPYLLQTDQQSSLEWLYEFNAEEHRIEVPCHILLSQHDLLVPHAKAKEAWRACGATSITSVAAQHSAPIANSDIVAQWLQPNE